jgi:hypothetical protein
VASVVKGRILGFLIRSVTCRDRYRVHSWGRVCRFREAFAARFWFLVRSGCRDRSGSGDTNLSRQADCQRSGSSGACRGFYIVSGDSKER